MSLEQKLDELFAGYASGDSPGAALLVSRNNEVLITKGYGLADVEERVPITPGTRFIIGSVTKQFTCMAIAILRHRGFLSFSDRVDDYVAGLPEWGCRVTLYQLMTHTAGVPGYLTEEFWEEAQERDFDFEQVLSRIRNMQELDFAPGTHFCYSNSGYILLQAVVESITQQDFGSFMQENVFGPLEMEDTTAGVRGVSEPPAGLAAGYEYESKEEFSPTPFNRTVVGWADGNIISTVGDMFLWEQSLRTCKLLPRELLEEAFTPVQPHDPSFSRYGLGWFRNCRRGVAELWHGGGTLGYVSRFGRFPTHGASIVLLSNAQGIALDRLYGTAAGLLLEEELEPVPLCDSVPVQWLEEKVGEYQAHEPFRGTEAPSLRVGYDAASGKLRLVEGVRELGYPLELEALGRYQFRLHHPADYYATFIEAQDNGVSNLKVRLDLNGAVYTLSRTDNSCANSEEG